MKKGSLYLVVIDGLGVGHQEDAADYGDVGSNTWGHVSMLTGACWPAFERLGAGNIIPLDSVPPVANPEASWGKMRELSKGKDSTTGHWEMAGLTLEAAFPTYPHGFPNDVIDAFCNATGESVVLGNCVASGTDIIVKFGEEHLKTGYPIVYTSADSVFQIAAHTDVVPLDKLYAWCEIARTQVCTGEHAVGRVIARPFNGKPGAFHRISEKRRDFSRKPHGPTLAAHLRQHGIETVSIGKVADLFAYVGFSRQRKTQDNPEGLTYLSEEISGGGKKFVFVNLIDTDQLFGHRNDVPGYAGSLTAIDKSLPALLDSLQPEDIIILTGDHGNDPHTPSTDHSREFVPLLVFGKKHVPSDLGIRNGFSDIAVSVCRYFGIEHPFAGSSFL
jgi:phosphopentomutase